MKLWLGMIAVGVYAVMGSAGAVGMMLRDAELTVTTSQPCELTFRVPEGWARCYLSLQGRLVNPAANWRGKSVWMNFEPLAEEEVALQSYRFVECYSNNAAVYSHLGCPTSLANEHVERTERDIGRSIRRMLLAGGLYLTYGIKYRTEGNILQDLYPITPLELHCGTVIGAEKIVTCVSGRYGFGDGCPLRVRSYDAGGFHLPARDQTIAAAKRTLADVRLEEGEMAIIFRSGKS